MTKLTQLQRQKFLQKPKTVKQSELEKIIRSQEKIEPELVKLKTAVHEVTEMLQDIAANTKSIVSGALISALLGCCIVFGFDAFEAIVPACKDNIIYLIVKALTICLITMFYIFRRSR